MRLARAGLGRGMATAAAAGTFLQPDLRVWRALLQMRSDTKDSAFDLIRESVVVTTLPEDFLAVLRAGTVSTNVFLRRLQNHCLDLGWLPVPVLS